MKNNIKIDYSSNTILVSKGFLEQAEMFGTDEYNIIKQIRKDYPEMMIVARTTKHGNRKSETKGLTYRYMRKFVALMDAQNMSTFNETIAHYEAQELDSTTVYHCVKDWFLENYPNHREMIVDAAPKRILTTAVFEQIEEFATAAA